MSRQTVLEIAKEEEGYTESYSNKTKYGEWYELDGDKWCAIFVSWVFDKAGHSLGNIDTPKGFHFCPSAYNFWRSQECLIDDPQPGDIVLYDIKKGGQKCDHTGIFVKWIEKDKSFLAWEGNSTEEGDTDGGHVLLQTRNYNEVYAFVDPDVF